jgi:hypothetical protein
MEMSGQLHAPAALSPPHHRGGRRSPGAHWIGGWVGPRVSLDTMEKRKILYCHELNLGRPARSPLLHWLSYPDSRSSDKRTNLSAYMRPCTCVQRIDWPYCCNIQLKLDKHPLLCTATFNFSPYHEIIISFHCGIQLQSQGYENASLLHDFHIFTLKLHCFRKMVKK